MPSSPNSQSEDGQEAERWLDTLRGRTDPDDNNTREAALLRALFEARERSADALALDPQREQKLLARVREAEARERAAVHTASPVPAEAPARPAPAPAPAGGGLAGRLWRWLLPDSGNPWRLAGAAAGVFGLALVVRTLQPAPPEADDATQMKSAPPRVVPRSATAEVPVAVVQGAEPLQRALALQVALQQAGVPADVFPLGAGARLEAAVPPDRRDAVLRALRPLGVDLPPGTPELVVEFRE